MTTVRIRRHKPVMTYCIIAVCVLVYLADRLSALTLLGEWGYGFLSIFGMRINHLISQGEWWRLVTPIFCHGSLTHLAMNCFALYIWGRYTETLYGPWKYGLVLLLAGFTGCTMGYAFSSYNSLGISGAVFGVFGMLLALWKDNRKLFNALFGVQVFIYAGVNLVMGFMNTGVDNWGHIGGLLGGFLAGIVVGLPWKRGKDIQQIAAAAAYVAVNALLIAIGRGFLF